MRPSTAATSCAENWPSLYSPEQGANEPAEELVQLEQGADYGWPDCYFDRPSTSSCWPRSTAATAEDGRALRRQASARRGLPGHWAPNDLLLYDGRQFPVGYRGGAFIAFHGSWNRAPSPQGGYNVVFQPFADGKPSGHYVVFADGFAGAVEGTGPGRAPAVRARGRPGRRALHLGRPARPHLARHLPRSDDGGHRGRPRTANRAGTSTAAAEPPEGIHPDAGSQAAALPTPPGATPAEVALGGRIFHGQVASAPCEGCHGTNAKGTPQGPDLTSGNWLWGDGSLASITQTIADGVPKPKEYGPPMPPMGGAQLSQSELAAVAAYVWALGHQNGP